MEGWQIICMADKCRFGNLRVIKWNARICKWSLRHCCWVRQCVVARDWDVSIEPNLECVCIVLSWSSDSDRHHVGCLLSYRSIDSDFENVDCVLSGDSRSGVTDGIACHEWQMVVWLWYPQWKGSMVVLSMYLLVVSWGTSECDIAGSL